MNDISRLKEEADIAMVVAYLGIPTCRKKRDNFTVAISTYDVPWQCRKW